MMANAMVHVVDDDPGVRKSLDLMLKSAGLAVRVYESGEDFLQTADRNRPGCMVLDLRMAGISGIEVLQRLRELQNPLPAIIISGHADLPTAVHGMKLGAVDVLQKPVEPRVLLEAIQSAIATSIEQQKDRAEHEIFRRRLSELTPRELELLKCVVAGMPNKRIATELKISIKTVANHRANLMAKTQALNAADLARMSTLAGITAPNSAAPSPSISEHV